MNLSHIQNKLEILMSDIKNNYYGIKDIHERKWRHTDELVDGNTISENKMILKYLKTDVYDVLKDYQDLYGKLEADDKKHFYAILTYHAIMEYYLCDCYYEEDEESEDEESEDEDDELSNADTDEPVNEK